MAFFDTPLHFVPELLLLTKKRVNVSKKDLDIGDRG